MAKITLNDIKAKTDGINGIKTATDKIADIETKVGEMEAKIKELEGLVGQSDGKDHKNDTGIYKAIHDNFTELMGGP